MLRYWLTSRPSVRKEHQHVSKSYDLKSCKVIDLGILSGVSLSDVPSSEVQLGTRRNIVLRIAARRRRRRQKKWTVRSRRLLCGEAMTSFI